MYYITMILHATFLQENDVGNVWVSVMELVLFPLLKCKATFAIWLYNFLAQTEL